MEVLESSTARRELYSVDNSAGSDSNCLIFNNPLFNDPSAITISDNKNKDSSGGSSMRLKDFLVSISSFADFSDQQLLTLEQKVKIITYKDGDMIIKQGDPGESFYVIHEGTVQVKIQEDKILLENDNHGKIVNQLSSGSYFGERALMQDAPRAATIIAKGKTVCLEFSRETFEEVISGSNALISKDVNDHVDLSKDHESRSLFQHIERILEIDDPMKGYSPEIKRVRYELATVFTPELLSDEVTSRMVITLQKAVKADRVGLFVVNEDRRSMVLKVSEKAKGVRLPVRGIAGAIIENNKFENILDAYQDPRFDSTMDRRTGYITKQILCVPVRDPTSGLAVGALQVNNRRDLPNDSFTDEQRQMLELAASQLSEILHDRSDMFVSTGGQTSKSFGAGVGEGTTIKHSPDISSPFTIELFSISFKNLMDTLNKGRFSQIEISCGVYLAISELCEPKSFIYDMKDSTAEMKLKARLEFDIAVRDLPRAARILFKIHGNQGSKSTVLAWAAATVFDFKGFLDSMIDISFFEGDIASPVKTSLSNSSDSNAASLSALLGADLIMNDESEDSSTPLVRIVHALPERTDPIVADSEKLTSEEEAQIQRLLKVSYNPIGLSLITNHDREFMWDIRRKILDRNEILPAFIMCMRWRNSDRVEELYNLLDLWKPQIPSMALILLDRRFMDPKVRAYAVHCLEDLENDELSLYMLQLCQQLKFENYVDSALSRFLLRRALRSKNLIGHMFYWQLQSEIHNPDVKKRFVVLLQIYIRNCGHHRTDLGKQVFVMKRLESVAELVAAGPSKQERLTILRDQLDAVALPSEFQLPLNPHLIISKIDVARCRVMESKKKPLWLTMQNSASEDIVLMLKVGDDLRQDALVMQLLRVMNLLWANEGFDMQMMLYDCVSTGDERGLLQVVTNAATIGNILLHATDKKQKDAGKTIKSGTFMRKVRSAVKALMDYKVIKDWVMEQVNEEFPPESTEESFYDGEVEG
jgi:CRP-like cAMP-binding protein